MSGRPGERRPPHPEEMIAMQFMVSVLDDRTGSATPSEAAAVDAFNERLRSQGHWVFAGGLASPGEASVIDNRGERPVVTDGPYVESKEHVAGLWIIEAPDHATARELASEGSRHCNRRVELRPLLGG